MSSPPLATRAPRSTGTGPRRPRRGGARARRCGPCSARGSSIPATGRSAATSSGCASSSTSIRPRSLPSPWPRRDASPAGSGSTSSPRPSWRCRSRRTPSPASGRSGAGLLRSRGSPWRSGSWPRPDRRRGRSRVRRERSSVAGRRFSMPPRRPPSPSAPFARARWFPSWRRAAPGSGSRTPRAPGAGRTEPTFAGSTSRPPPGPTGRPGSRAWNTRSGRPSVLGCALEPNRVAVDPEHRGRNARSFRRPLIPRRVGRLGRKTPAQDMRQRGRGRVSSAGRSRVSGGGRRRS